MEGVSLVRYSPDAGDHFATAQLVECFRDVFADGPWHEWLRCPRCKVYWGMRDRSLLASYRFRHCDEALVDYRSRDKVVADLYREITSEASCWLATVNGMIVGFCWGYPMTVANLETKFGISFGANLGFGVSQSVAYQNEVGVLPAYRGRSIAKMLVTRRHEDFCAQGLQVGILRTRQSPEPSLTFLWYTQKLGYEILGAHPDNGTVVLGRRLIDLQDLLL